MSADRNFVAQRVWVIDTYSNSYNRGFMVRIHIEMML